MTSHSERVTLPYSPKQLFDLVAGVDKYPEFLPWCIGARIIRRDGNVLYADLVIGWKILRERFRSKVVLDEPGAVQFEYTNGPLKYLKGEWRFRPAASGGTEVSFQVDFEFKSRALSVVMGGVFSELVHRMVGAYEARAAQLYGKPGKVQLRPAGESLQQKV